MKKQPKRRSAPARDLAGPKYRARVVPNKRRKKLEQARAKE